MAVNGVVLMCMYTADKNEEQSTKSRDFHF